MFLTTHPIHHSVSFFHISNETFQWLWAKDNTLQAPLIPSQLDEDEDIEDPFCQTAKNQCSCMHPTSQFCCYKRCLDFTISSHMALHYIVHGTSSILDISHPSCNDDYQPLSPLTPLGQFLTHLGFVLFITSLCLFLP